MNNNYKLSTPNSQLSIRLYPFEENFQNKLSADAIFFVISQKIIYFACYQISKL